MNAIVPHQPPLNYGDLERLAASIAQSALFGIKTKDQAIVLMMIAHAEGRHPALAARDYDIINGRPAKKAEAMMREFLEAGGKVEWHTLSDEKADATFTHPKTGSVRIDWDMERVKTAFGAKDMYKKFPRQMLRSRVVSEGVRTLWPLATSGMYVPEEAADIPTDTHTGPTIDHTAPDRRDEINAEVPVRQPAAAAAMQRAPRVTAPTPNGNGNGNGNKAPRLSREDQEWIDDWQASFDAAMTNAVVKELEASAPYANAIRKAPPFLVERLRAMACGAYWRVAPKQPAATTYENAPENDPANHPDGGPVIAGSEYAAG